MASFHREHFNSTLIRKAIQEPNFKNSFFLIGLILLIENIQATNKW
jgi:hypothetical protein